MAFGLGSLVLVAMLAVTTYLVAQRYLLDQRERSAVRRAFLDARIVRDTLSGELQDPNDALKNLELPPGSQAAFAHSGEWFATSVAVGPRSLPRDLRGLKFGFIADPYGTKIEVMEDKDTLGFHHIHLRGKDPKGLLDWYQRVFGGERTQFKGMIDGLKYGNVWLLAQSSGETEPEPTQGRSLDHLGWMIPKLDDVAIEFKAKNVKFTTEPRDLRLGSERGRRC